MFSLCWWRGWFYNPSDRRRENKTNKPGLISRTGWKEIYEYSRVLSHYTKWEWKTGCYLFKFLLRNVTILIVVIIFEDRLCKIITVYNKDRSLLHSHFRNCPQYLEHSSPTFPQYLLNNTRVFIITFFFSFSLKKHYDFLIFRKMQIGDRSTQTQLNGSLHKASSYLHSSLQK